MSLPGSKLQKLIIEELAYVYHQPTAAQSREKLAAVVDGKGVLVQFFATCESYREEESSFTARMRTRTRDEWGDIVNDGDQRPHWSEYLVGEEPARHWMHDAED